jgi:hypothetical protein
MAELENPRHPKKPVPFWRAKPADETASQAPFRSLTDDAEARAAVRPWPSEHPTRRGQLTTGSRPSALCLTLPRFWFGTVGFSAPTLRVRCPKGPLALRHRSISLGEDPPHARKRLVGLPTPLSMRVVWCDCHA